jgi:tRNA-modifying protein YgfZ
MTNDAFLAQYVALTQGVGIAELPGRTVLAITGADRVHFLHSFSTNDVKRLSVGGGCEAFITNSQGKTLGHVLIFCGANQHILDTTPGQAATLIAHFDRYIITEDVQFGDRTPELTDLLLAGPKAAALLAAVSGANPPTERLAHSPTTISVRAVVVLRVD